MITLTVGFSKNSRLEPLFQGRVRPQNIDLQFVYCSPGDLFYRNLKYDEFDVSEMSISEYLMTRERRDGTRWQWTGLPVFLSKAFLWLQFYANSGAGIENLADLNGKRVGIPDYTMTAALWMRAFLKELYSICPEEITWYNGRTKELSHSGIMGLDRRPPKGIDLRWLTENQSLDQLLDRGEIDAAYGVKPTPGRESSGLKVLDRYGGTPVDGNPRLRPLFKDSGKQVVLDYFRKTGILPANHMVIVKNAVLEKYPWVALELFKTFQKSKELAYQWAAEMSRAHLLFEGEDLRKQSEVFGADPYPLGLNANRKMLEILARSSFEQGLTQQLTVVDELFFPVTRDT
jgi:4,5-dihydroxyphthalate decarboxylase